MKIRSLSALFAAVVLAGCASGPPPAPFYVGSTAPLAPPPADKAQIVFLDPANAIQGVIPAWLYDVNGKEGTLLAVMGPHSKSVQLVAPGHHLFVSNAPGGTHLLEADVVAGKRYYVLLRFVYAHGMQLRPLRPTGTTEYTVNYKDFGDWVSSTTFFVKTPHADEFDQKHADLFAKERDAALAEWSKKSPDQRAELTLNAGDAVDR
jgi:hypothetical protein